MTSTSVSNTASAVRLTGDPPHGTRVISLADNASDHNYIRLHSETTKAPSAESQRNPDAQFVRSPAVEIQPSAAAARRSLSGHGFRIEDVRCAAPNAISCRFRDKQHLIVVYRTAERSDGETAIDGKPPSRSKSLSGKISIVPAGCQYRDRFNLSVDVHLTFLYLDPGRLPILTQQQFGNVDISARLPFLDSALWNTALKLGNLIEGDASPPEQFYLDALGIVLAHDFVRAALATPVVHLIPKGGLAGWQQRLVTAYIDEHFARRIPLNTLAKLARLSSFHFCRAFKQSFGMSPRQYQAKRRIDRAKLLLAEGEMSMTDIALEIGFSNVSSFAAAFRRATGLSPSTYSRTL
jgi:AraC family transcriptional regulator